MAFATASSPANRKPGANAQAAAPPQAQARPRQSPGKAEPLRAPEPPARAGTKTGLRSVSLAKQRVPAAKNRVLSSRGQNRQFFAASRPKRSIICAIGKPIRAQPAKTSVSHFRDREKPSVLTANDQNRRFFASRPTRQPNPMPNMQRSRHQSRRAFRKAQSQTPSREPRRLRKPSVSQPSCANLADSLRKPCRPLP